MRRNKSDKEATEVSVVDEKERERDTRRKGKKKVKKKVKKQ